MMAITHAVAKPMANPIKSPENNTQSKAVTLISNSVNNRRKCTAAGLDSEWIRVNDTPVTNLHHTTVNPTRAILSTSFVSLL